MYSQMYSPSDSWDPKEKQRIESGRPSSRLEVQQSLLDHNRQRNRDLSIDVKQDRSLYLSVDWLRKPIGGSRRVIGRLLMNVGQRVYPEST